MSADLRPQFLPGTDTVVHAIDVLIGGVDSDTVDESGGPVGFADSIQDGACCCEPGEDGASEGIPETWCLKCQAIVLLAVLHGGDWDDADEWAGPSRRWW